MIRPHHRDGFIHFRAKERIMKRFVSLSTALFALALLGFGQKVDLRIGGGWNYALGGDLAAGLQGQSDYIHDQYAATGQYKAPKSGWGGEGELILTILPRLGIGIGAGYLRHVQESQIAYASSSISITEKVKPDISVIPVTLNVHYLLPLSAKLRLDIHGGAGYYLATWNWTCRMDLSLLGYSGYDEYTFRASKGGIGVQVGFGLEWEFASHIALVLGVTGRTVSIDSFLGSWTEKGDGDFWQFSDSGNDHFAWYYDWQVGSKTYGQLAFQPSQPAGSTASNVRTAKLDLSGFTATLGFKIGFGR
jgi:hypothetical protein